MQTLWLKWKDALKAAPLVVKVCFLITLVLTAWIPSLGAELFASPDETAVAVVVRRLAAGHLPAVSESLAEAYPWLHPRSWVSHGPALVPVGFLGWPLLLTPFVRIFGSKLLPWLGWLTLWSSLIPLFLLLRKYFSLRAAWVGVGIAFASPVFILYANRGLFPNVGVFALGLWSLWALSAVRKQEIGWWLPGILCGAVFMIRPIELIWLGPWWLWSAAGFRSMSKKDLLLFLIGGLFILLPFFWLNQKTYGAWWNIGYWIRDNSIKSIKIVLNQNSQDSISFLPFGFHPRHIVWNLRFFTQAFLWPLFTTAFIASLLFINKTKVSVIRGFRHLPYPLILGLYTVLVLLVVYGSGLYQDHIQPGAVTVGNSFLRYLFPILPLASIAAAYIVDASSNYSSQKIWLSVLFSVYVIFGVFCVTFKDDEGIVATRRELKRYQEMNRALPSLPLPDVILSQRSDKIFVPLLDLHSVSPLPSIEEMSRLVKDRGLDLLVGLYARPLSQREKDEWREHGVEVEELQSFARERLYYLRPQ